MEHLVDVADAVGDAALQHDRLFAECQPDVVERVQVEETTSRPGTRRG
jgi:hypothetical protein